MLARIPRPMAALGIAALVMTATACSGQGAKDEPTPVAPPPATTVQAPATTKEPQPTVTVTEQQTQTKAPEQAPAEKAFPAGQLVAADEFKRREAYNWKSPSGRIFCGVMPTGETMFAGCQMASALPECGPDFTTSAPLVRFAERGLLERTCTTQGVYVDSESRVLDYGQQIDVGPFTAVSQQDGMYMRHRQTGEAFSIAVEGIETFKTPI